MKPFAWLTLTLLICLTACANDGGEAAETTWDFGNEAPYAMPDGREFSHKITLTGRMPNAAHDNSITVYTDDASITYGEVMQSVYASDDSALKMWERCYIDWTSSIVHD